MSLHFYNCIDKYMLIINNGTKLFYLKNNITFADL